MSRSDSPSVADAAAPRPALLSRLRELARRNATAISYGLLNQATASATSFALLFVLVRILSPAEYGEYGMGLAVCYICNGLGNDLLLTQMVVHYPERAPRERSVYAARVLVALLGCCAALIVLLVATSAGLAMVVPALRGRIPFTVAVSVAATGYLTKDFFIRQAYAEGKEHRALVVTGSAAVTLFGLLGVGHVGHWELSATRALFLFGGAQLAGSVVGFVLARLPTSGLRVADVVQDVKECWSHGRWAVGASAIWLIQAQAYTFATAVVVGPAGVGQINAARLFVAPMILLAPALNQVTVPRLAELRLRDPARAVATGGMITCGMMMMATLYSGALLLFASPLARAVLGPTYAGITPLIVAWCGALLALVARDGATSLLQSTKRFRSLLGPNAVSAVAAVALQFILLHAMGALGAIVATAAADLLLAVLLWRVIKRGTPQTVGEVKA